MDGFTIFKMNMRKLYDDEDTRWFVPWSFKEEFKEQDKKKKPVKG